MEPNRKRRSPESKHQERGDSIKQKNFQHDVIITPETLEQKKSLKNQNIYNQWKEKEEAFNIEQAKLRSGIRIKEKREKPVDFFTKVYETLEHHLPPPNDFNKKSEYMEPYKFFEDISHDEILELYEDIRLHSQFESGIEYSNYWTSLLTLCNFYMEFGNPKAKTQKGKILDEHKIFKEGIDEVFFKKLTF
jgi:hypothetical protein